jgi:pyruvate/2-oxoglutarate dehydrogenase complex dihydrolipoamide dehydrogenase (E3) component
MVADASAIHMALRAGECGVVVPEGTSIDMKVVVAWREAIVTRSRNGADGSLQKDHGITVFTGTAEFASPNTVRVGEDVLEAEQIFLDVCARGPCSKSAGYPRHIAKATH